jgi:ABC-type multidrug transport system fused ATPase/permease subunit
MKNIFRMLRLISDMKYLLIGAVFANALLGLSAIASPYLFKLIVDQAILASHSTTTALFSHSALIVLGLLLGTRIVTAITDMLSDKIANHLFFTINAKLRHRLFSHVLGLSLDYFEQFRAAEIQDKATAGILDFSRWLNNLISNVLALIFSLIFSLAVIWLTNPLTGFIVSLIVPINFIIAVATFRYSKKVQREAQKVMGQASGVMGESLNQISTIRSFGNEDLALNNYDGLVMRWKNLSLSRFKIRRRTGLLREFLQAIMLTGGVASLFYQVQHGKATPGDIVLIIILINQVQVQIRQIALLATDTAEITTSTERVIELLNEKPSFGDKDDAITLEKLESIEFVNVTFIYPRTKRKILDNVSFEIRSGTNIAIVGPSGVGKTTITKLLLRFYEPSLGSILINGISISDYTQVSIRKQIGMVMQDVALFNESIGENLRFAKPKATDAHLKIAAKLAHADDFISKLPDGYDTMVGERGIKLSGGEKQRVAIARAILRDPNLVILDEATSALDSESEQFVQQGLATLMEGKTAIIIAHRLSTIMKADQILVLQDGKIVERGDHRKLANKKSGLYARLYKLQTEGAIS